MHVLMFLRSKDAAPLIGVSLSTLWRLDKTDPDFPKRVVMSNRSVLWRMRDLLDYRDRRNKKKAEGKKGCDEVN